MKKLPLAAILALALAGCGAATPVSQAPQAPQAPPLPATADAPVSVELLQRVLAAFNAHDLDAVMAYFAEDAVLEMPRGHDPWGTRYEGKTAVRAGLATRFAGIPDVHYGDDRHWVSGNRGVSEWTLTGTTTAGQHLEVRGCDLLEFRDGKIVRKNSFWKIIEK